MCDELCGCGEAATCDDGNNLLQEGTPPLRSIYYNPVGGCNLQCKHCWVDPDFDARGRDAFTQRERLDNELTLAQYTKIIEDAKTMGLASVKFTGGEPFIRSDTIDMIEATRARGVNVSIETNATLLDKSTVERLAKVGISQVSVSLDHTSSDYHDKFRGVKNAHANAIRGIKMLVEAKFNVQIIMAVTHANLDNCAELIAMARELGTRSVKLCPVRPVGRGENLLDDKLLSVEEFLELYKTYGTLEGNGRSVHVEVPLAFRPLKSLKKVSLCGIQTLLGLLPNGDVSYCGIGMDCPELIMGNLLKDELKELWENHKLLCDVRGNLANKLEGICACCTMRRMCLGMCRVHEYVATGSMYAPNMFCRDAEKLGIFPESRRLRTGAITERE